MPPTTPQPDPSDDNDNRPRQKALTALQPALHILERFHHRNKNQHRLSKWWSHADMLRRHLRKLLDSLQDGLAEEERDLARKSRAVSASSSKKKRKAAAGVETNEKMDSFGIHERAVYMRGTLVPRAYLAFTQVTADRQFAHLGLMLLGTLAQVDAALVGFAPDVGDGEEEEKEEGGVSTVVAQNEKEGGVRKETTTQNQLGVVGEEDLGVPISRDEFLAVGKEDVGVPISRDEFLAVSGGDVVVERKSRTTQHMSRKTVDIDTDMDIDTPKQTKRQLKKIQKVDIDTIENDEYTRETTTTTTSTSTAITQKKKKKRPIDEYQDQTPNMFDINRSLAILNPLLREEEQPPRKLQPPPQDTLSTRAEKKTKLSSTTKSLSSSLSKRTATTKKDKEKKKKKKGVV